MFDKSFQKYKTAWQRVGIIPSSKVYAHRAHLFLCSEFCGPDLALAKFKAWDNWVHDQYRGTSFKRSAGIDELFAMNLQINMIRKKNNWSIDETNGCLAYELGAKLQQSGGPVVGWG